MGANAGQSHIMHARRIAALLAGAAASALIAAGAAQAQAPAGATPSTAATASATDAGSVGEIVVTGSRIAGVAPVGSTVQAIGRRDVEVSGAVTTTQLIQQAPQVFNLGISETSRGQSGGSGNITYGTTINLRGIGPYTTLIMLDGHRAVPQGTTGFAVDPSVIPTIALERVEIVADGASAIYGSDAIAGVVNLIRRRNVEGVEANARFGFGDGYSERQVGAILGHSWGSGRFTLAYENGYHSALNGSKRSFFVGDLRPFGGSDFRVTQCNPGNITVGGQTYAIPAGGVTAANRGALVAGTTNKCDNQRIADLIPRQSRNSISATFDQEFSETISFYGDAFATQRNFKNRTGGAASTVTVPSTNAFFVLPTGVTATSESVGYSFINDYPQGYTDGFSKAYEATIGGRFKMAHGWKFEADWTWGRDTDRSISHYVANAAALNAALASSNPATAFNVYGGPNSQAVINNILIGRSEAPGRSSLSFYEAKLDGPIATLPGGEVKVALGYEGQNLHVVQNNIAGTIAAPTQTVRRFNRQVQSGYAEMLIPFVSSANAMPGVRRLDVDLAGRVDSYSDVGETWNPKVGVNWSPAEGLTFRGNYGTSFRAPTISQIYGNTNNLFVQNYSDPTCGCVRQGVARSGANLNLKPETAKTWSIGADYQPGFLPRSKLSLTYFNIDYENQVVAYLSDLTVLQRESQFAGTGIIVRNPSQAFINQQLAETGFTGVIPNPLTVFVEGRNSNLGTTIARGIDFIFTYAVPTSSMGDFTFGVNGTYFTEYKVAITPSAPLINQLNTIFNPLKFKARASVAWQDGPWSANAFLNYQNPYDNNLSTPVQRVSAYTTVDLRAAYRFNVADMHNLTFAVDAMNVFDKSPPFVNIAQSANGGGGFDPTLTNPVGRVIGVSLSGKF